MDGVCWGRKGLRDAGYAQGRVPQILMFRPVEEDEHDRETGLRNENVYDPKMMIKVHSFMKDPVRVLEVARHLFHQHQSLMNQRSLMEYDHTLHVALR